MPWSRRFFSNQNTDEPVKVWVRVNEQDELIQEDNRAQIRYEDDTDAKVYDVHPTNLSQINEESDDRSLDWLESPYRQTRTVSKNVPSQLQDQHPPEEKIEVYTDGSAIKESGAEEGPAGLGVVLRSPNHYKEVQQYLGTVSNQVAELAALYVGLEQISRFDIPVTAITDSRYAQGMVENEDWEANANQGLVSKLRKRANKFNNLDVEWVEGHSGNPFNERADDIAKEAINLREQM